MWSLSIAKNQRVDAMRGGQLLTQVFGPADASVFAAFFLEW